jgi:hypothetical protein
MKEAAVRNIPSNKGKKPGPGIVKLPNFNLSAPIE